MALQLGTYHLRLPVTTCAPAPAAAPAPTPSAPASIANPVLSLGRYPSRRPGPRSEAMVQHRPSSPQPCRVPEVLCHARQWYA